MRLFYILLNSQRNYALYRVFTMFFTPKIKKRNAMGFVGALSRPTAVL